MTTPTDAPAALPPHKTNLKRTALTLVKLAIAIGGIFLVARMVTWNDTATLPAGIEIRTVILLKDTPVTVLQERSLPGPTAASPARNLVRVRFPDTPVDIKLDGRPFSLRLDDQTPIPNTRQTLGLPHEMDLNLDLFKEEKGERVHHGFHTLLLEARGRWYLLLAAWAVLVIPFLVTAIRWRNLLKPQGIEMPLPTALRLTFVGQFYSIILPGITGGDLVKILYAARLTGSKTKSFITVILDRVIGLVALMVIAGAAAASQLLLNREAAKPLDPTLLNVLLFILAGLGGLAVGSLVYFSHRVRRATGLAKILQHPRIPEFVRHIDETLHAYRRHSRTLIEAFLISIISQFTLPLSASLAGAAFGMHIPLTYYLSYVPIAILATSLPISLPQGIGVLDGIIYHFFVNRANATPAQAFALAQSIRFLPLLWNLVGAYWVIRGTHSMKQSTEPQADKTTDLSSP